MHEHVCAWEAGYTRIGMFDGMHCPRQLNRKNKRVRITHFVGNSVKEFGSKIRIANLMVSVIPRLAAQCIGSYRALAGSTHLRAQRKEKLFMPLMHRLIVH
jgi:hypothetical protein